ncbi:L-threonine 3-O-phosphate decarboxylase [Desulfocucumis palustris]|uniref:threonine-phosphate decarboxylase n=1 Tax=Desulfocucumis palustris TaxID=1898651 RepID=A0A2L2X943_9FIRM|nr:threonine-phosphate decarboxylase CobD [Desulfocucumis palustris]GBF32749.1 L-threonine 3-O-phosphate decarboxylase [Desulfocucumis palustris]
MLLKQHQHGGNLARAAREYGLPERELIDFSASINPLGPSPGVFRAIAENLWRIRHYPDPDCRVFLNLLGEYLGVPPECIVPGNGGAELIYMLPTALKVTSALVVAPTFSEYSAAIRAAGGETEYFRLPVEGEIYSHLTELADKMAGYQAVFICNPNNPTGRLFRHDELSPLLEAASKTGTMLVVDEAFMDFVARRRDFTLMPRAVGSRNLVVLYSLTKFFGIPGLRLGALVAQPELAAELNRKRDPWRVNALAQVAAEAALADKGHMAATLDVVRTEREYLTAALSGIPGVRPLPGAANFLLLDLSRSGKNVQEIIIDLGRRGLLVRDCSNFYGLDGCHIRTAVRSREENDRLIAALREIMGGN